MEQPARQKVLQEFPRLHINNLGGGLVGPIFLTRNEQGRIEHAEAELFGAPFRSMVITSSKLLEMFGDRGDRIDISVLGHPWPEFRLVEREKENWDVGVLTQLQYVRDNHKSGHIPMDKAVIKRTVRPNPRFLQKPQKSTLEGKRHLAQPMRVSKRTNKNSTVAPSTSSPTFLDETSVANEMHTVRTQIHDLLSPFSRKRYDYFISTGSRRGAKEGQSYRSRLKEKMKVFFEGQGENCQVLARLHNQYAVQQRKLVTRWALHLPILRELENNEYATEKMVAH